MGGSRWSAASLQMWPIRMGSGWTSLGCPQATPTEWSDGSQRHVRWIYSPWHLVEGKLIYSFFCFSSCPQAKEIREDINIFSTEIAPYHEPQDLGALSAGSHKEPWSVTMESEEYFMSCTFTHVGNASQNIYKEQDRCWREKPFLQEFAITDFFTEKFQISFSWTPAFHGINTVNRNCTHLVLWK